jgi:hypothetical protein
VTTVVWMPYRGDGGWRDRNFDVAYRQASSLGFDVIVADSGDDPFSIARTWNQCAKDRPWDRAIRWAGDFVLTDTAPIHAALAVDHHYVFAFDSCSTLTDRQTRHVHKHGPRPFPPSRLPFGGINVVTRALWEDVGGFDERFVGWGHEDRAFVHAVEILHGPRKRVPGHMLNLWHPKRRQQPTAEYFAHQERNHYMWMEYQQITEPDELRAWMASIPRMMA